MSNRSFAEEMSLELRDEKDKQGKGRKSLGAEPETEKTWCSREPERPAGLEGRRGLGTMRGPGSWIFGLFFPQRAEEDY